MNERGLYQKFDVRRMDGSDGPSGKHYQCCYFVLDLTHDPHAVPALKAYAKSCKKDYPQLARDLEAIVDGNKLMPYRTQISEPRAAQADPPPQPHTLREFAEFVEKAPERLIAIMRRERYVFHRFPRDMVKQPPSGDGERWEALAFRLYSELGELSSRAIRALNEADEGRAPAPADVDPHRLAAQMREISVLLSEAGVGACSLIEGVRTVIRRAAPAEGKRHETSVEDLDIISHALDIACKELWQTYSDVADYRLGPIYTALERAQETVARLVQGVPPAQTEKSS